MVSALALCWGPAHALGLGALQVQSALRVPLRASIPLVGNDTENLAASCIKARVASLDGDMLAPLRVDVVSGRGNPSLVLTSAGTINEPLASIVVEIACGQGIRREYQLLLDPPGFTTAEPVAVAPTGARSQPADTQEAARSGAAVAPRAAPAAQDRPVVAPRAASRPALRPPRSEGSPAIGGTVNPRERNVLRLSPSSPGFPSRLELKLSTVLSDPALLPPLLPLPPSEAPLAVDSGEAAAQMQRAASQIEAMQAKMNAMEQELIRLRQSAAAVPASVKPAVPKDADATRWYIAVGLLLLLALAWLGWRLRRLKPTSSGINWSDEAGRETIRQATQLAMMRSANKRSRDPAEQGGLSADVRAGLQSALEKNYVAPINMVAAEPLSMRANQKSALAEFLGADQDEVPLMPSAPPASAPPQLPPEQVPETPFMTFEFPGKKEYATSGALLQTPFDVDVGSRGRPLMTEAEEIVDARQQAEFWMSLQDPQRAVQALELYTYEHVQRPDSPLPWLLLFDLYRDLGYQAKYEDLYKRYRGRFNSKVPKWGEEPQPEQTGGLENFPRLVHKTCELWGTAEIVPFLEGLLLDDRDGKREGFELPVYNDILFLAELAYELNNLPKLELEPVVSSDAPQLGRDPWAKAE